MSDSAKISNKEFLEAVLPDGDCKNVSVYNQETVFKALFDRIGTDLECTDLPKIPAARSVKSAMQIKAFFPFCRVNKAHTLRKCSKSRKKFALFPRLNTGWNKSIHMPHKLSRRLFKAVFFVI